MVPDLLTARQKTLKAFDGEIVDWFTPDTHAHDLGESSLALLKPGRRTVKLKPEQNYSTEHQHRVWLGTNNIPYTSSLDDREIGFTFFAQINDAATVKVFIYNTSSDPDHDVNADDGSWFLKWTTNFPYSGDNPSWDYDYPSEMNLTTLIENSGLVGTLTEIDIKKSPYTIDGGGFLTDNKWNVIRTNWHRLPSVTLSRNIGVFIEITYDTPGLDKEEAVSFLTFPSVVTRYGYAKNNIGHELLYYSLPQVLHTNDSLSSNVERPLSRLIDVLTHLTDITDQFVENWNYYDIESGYSDDDISTKSKLTDPTVSPLSSLLWLSQFIDTKRELVRPTSTAWSGLPSTWSGIETLVDSDADDIVTWVELENYSPSFSKLVDYLRFAITTGYVGFRAGSEDAIVDTVKFFLDNNKVAFIDKNPVSTNRFSVTLYTYIGDTPDATGVGGTSELVQAAIAISKPVGIEVVHEILADI